MAVGGDVTSSGFAIAPGAPKHAIFTADRETSLNELWSTPIMGGTPVKLSGTIPAGSTGSQLPQKESGRQLGGIRDRCAGEWLAATVACSQRRHRSRACRRVGHAGGHRHQ